MNQDSIDLMRNIVGVTGAAGATLFLFDRQAPADSVRFLFNLGPTSETNRAYQDSICARDPFLQLAAAEPGIGSGKLRVIDQAEVEAVAVERQTRPYWEFMQRRGYSESAALARELSGSIHLVLGLMRQGRGPGGERLSARRACEATHRLFDQASASVMQAALRGFMAQAPAPRFALSRGLTAREQEVTVALCRGLSNKQIAAELQLSELTVENHLRRIYRKHAVRNRTSLMAALGSIKAAERP